MPAEGNGYLHLVRLLLKKVGLDAGDQKSFRPVSNLPFLSKLLEGVVQARLQAFLESNRLMPKTHSAYRKYHSTETAVTRVYTDLSVNLACVEQL